MRYRTQADADRAHCWRRAELWLLRAVIVCLGVVVIAQIFHATGGPNQ